MTELIQQEVLPEQLIPGETYLIDIIPQMNLPDNGLPRINLARSRQKLRGVFIENIHENDHPRIVSRFNNLTPAGEHGQTNPIRQFGRNADIQYRYFRSHAARLEAKRKRDNQNATNAALQKIIGDPYFDYTKTGGRKSIKRKSIKRKSIKRKSIKRNTRRRSKRNTRRRSKRK